VEYAEQRDDSKQGGALQCVSVTFLRRSASRSIAAMFSASRRPARKRKSRPRGKPRGCGGASASIPASHAALRNLDGVCQSQTHLASVGEPQESKMVSYELEIRELRTKLQGELILLLFSQTLLKQRFRWSNMPFTLLEAGSK
jgi:hypothetical protein